MKCDNNGCEKPAVVHYTEIVNGNKKEYHLCADCAQEKGLLPTVNFEVPSVAAFSSQLAAMTRSEKDDGTKCPSCKITYSDFQSSGRLGCAKDYEAFWVSIKPLIQKLQMVAFEHKGKVPTKIAPSLIVENKDSSVEIVFDEKIIEEEVSKEKVETQKNENSKDKIARLKAELNDVIEKEEYERAAVLRDEINELEAGEK